MINLKSFDELKKELLTEDIQRESNKYLEELNKLDSYGRNVAQKKIEAEKQIPAIKKQIALLNAEYYKENDSEKIKEIEDERFNLRLKLDDLEGLVNTNIKAIINQKFLKDLEGYEEKSRYEKILFEAKVRATKEQYFELRRKVEEKIQELTLIEHIHPYNRAIDLKNEIKRMDYIQDSGWVSEGSIDTRDNTNVLFSEGVIYGVPGEE